MVNIRTSVTAIAAAALLAACASGPNRTAGDPLEPMNRFVFKVNDTVDTKVAVPIAKGYQKITPHPLRTAISNFFSNLGDVNNIANELLQLKITDATEDVIRVAMNTVFGVGGLIDFATLAKLPKHHQDFGLTLGHWGVPSGPYLVLPLFGPSTFRDATGLIVDVRFNPINYVEPAYRTPLYIIQFVSVRSDLLGATNVLQEAALDKYSFVRDAYLQRRRSQLGTDQNPAPLPNYNDEGGASAAPATPAAASGTAPAAAPAAASGSVPATPTAPTIQAEPAAPAPAPAPPSKDDKAGH